MSAYGSGNPFTRSAHHQNAPMPTWESYQNPGVLRATYEANNQATGVLNVMSTQRGQLLGARDSARVTVETTKLAKTQLNEIRSKARWRIRKLYCIIGILAAIDVYLLHRMWICGGSFFCYRS